LALRVGASLTQIGRLRASRFSWTSRNFNWEGEAFLVTTAPNRKIFCDYHEGMFACEPWTGLNTDTPRDRVAREAVMFHESGHAVVQYALGLGCSAISLMITKVMRNGNELSYCHGSCASNRVTVRGIVSRIARGNINAGVLAHGIATAAGPAAERKYYLSQGLPFRMLSSTEADRNDIDGTDRKLASAGRNRFAYRRLVWRRAQLALENEIIWNAVQEMADALKDYWPTGGTISMETGTMHGATARAKMRRTGVLPGVLGFVA
jgi:hypothetical protein